MLDNILSTSCTALGELLRSQGADANMHHRFQTRQVPSHPRPLGKNNVAVLGSP